MPLNNHLFRVGHVELPGLLDAHDDGRLDVVHVAHPLHHAAIAVAAVDAEVAARVRDDRVRVPARPRRGHHAAARGCKWGEASY